MSIPGNYNITMYQGDTFVHDFQVVRVIGGVEQPVDFTEHIPLSQVRVRAEDEEVVAEFAVTYIDAEMGKVRLSMDSEITRDLPRVSFYDFQTVDTVTGFVKTWVAGKLTSPREVSRDYEDGEQ